MSRTFSWIILNFLAAVFTVLFVRAKLGCADFTEMEMPDMPCRKQGEEGEGPCDFDGELTNGSTADAALWLIPVYVVAAMLLICGCKFFVVNYCLRGPMSKQLKEEDVLEALEYQRELENQREDEKAKNEKKTRTEAILKAAVNASSPVAAAQSSRAEQQNQQAQPLSGSSQA